MLDCEFLEGEVPLSFSDFAGLREGMVWWAHEDSNLGQSGYEPEALPTEL